jgi:hypothetical protein
MVTLSHEAATGVEEAEHVVAAAALVGVVDDAVDAVDEAERVEEDETAAGGMNTS